MAQFTQESFTFDLVWMENGRLYADPIQLYDRSEAMSEHIQAAKFRWVLPKMDKAEITPLMAHWKDATTQQIAPGVKFAPDASGSHVSDDPRSQASPPPPAPKSPQERF